MMERDFKGIWIPKEIWEQSIPINDKFYLSVYEETKDVKATDEIMESVLSKSSVLKIKNRLAQSGRITFIKTPEQAKQFTLDVIGQGKTCEWCGRKNYILHEHHYPIPKVMGGDKTVKICPNCHAVFHYVYKGE